MELDYNLLEDDDDLEIIDLINFGIPRQVYVRTNHFDTLDSASFRRRYRLSKECTLDLLGLIDHTLEFASDINICVAPINQLLICLRIYATGGHLQTIADVSGMHVSTVSRIVRRVTNAIAQLYRTYVSLPEIEALPDIQQEFFNISSFPRVIGAIDCTHVKINSPGGEDPEIFRNRKSYFSLNVQMICDAKLKIWNVVARWPGSVHDATIFNSSAVKLEFDEGRYPNCILLGDSGYANSPYLCTPLLNPQTQAEQLYNEAHIRTRNTIERCFGVLKRRFPVLAYGCRLKIDTVLEIIVATAVLHNMALRYGDVDAPALPEEVNEEEFEELIQNGNIEPILNGNGNERNGNEDIRRQLINNYFANL